MGTNYYYHPSGERTCPHCGHETASLHIGKSSWGWNFSLRVHPHEGITSLDDWRERWASGGAIFDEYDERVEPADMLSLIVDRPPGRTHTGLTFSLDCKPGGPTWDLCHYEFS
jgi:hypothetical protein